MISTKALAINTCPERDRSPVSRLLNPFMDGLRASGAEIELYYAGDLAIFPCCGNLNCTVRTPGTCMARDDMRWLREKIGVADVLVLASPLYFDGSTGPDSATPALKLLLARLAEAARAPAARPYEHAVHTTREPVSLRKVVLVSGRGFVEIDGFNPVLTHLKAFCQNAFPELAGSVTGPCPVSIRALPPGRTAPELATVARNAGTGLAGDLRAPAAATPAPRARDGGEGPAGVRREWEPVTLFEFGVIH